MPQTLDACYRDLHPRLKAVGQEQVLAFWESLGPSQRQQLLDDLSGIDVSQLPALADLATAGQAQQDQDSRGPGGGGPGSTASWSPVQAIPRPAIDSEAAERGRALLSAGKVAALTVAGGQGTRLGFDGPKGALPISPIKNKPLFQLFAEAIRATDRRYDCPTPWYIMTSPANDQATRAFFREHSYFGLAAERVCFFPQGVMPAFDLHGKMLLDQQHRLALAPDGHGGTLLALARTGMLADMADRGVEIISYFQVDNPLVACLDPAFIGLHDLHGSEMSSKALPKADDFERVGNFARAGGRLVVIEYSDLPERLARARNPDGSRKFDAGNIAVHLLSRGFVEGLTRDAANFALPWHRAVKKAPYVDQATGRRLEPTEPNAVKLESFIFDALPLARHPMVMETSRAEEFSPVKNATGVDSMETARRDMNRRAVRWLESAGHQVPRTPDGEPDGTFEISPLLALDAAQLAERNLPVEALEAGTRLYLE